MKSPRTAPDYELYRTVKAADGGGPYETYKHGCNAGDIAQVNLQVIPGGSDANVAARVLFWSEGAGEFIEPSPAQEFGPSSDPFEFSINANGRIFFVEITGTVSNTRVYASTAPENF